MKPSIAKKAISLILLFGLSGVGVTAAHAQKKNLEGINSAPSPATKNQGERSVKCFQDSLIQNKMHDEGEWYKIVPLSTCNWYSQNYQRIFYLINW